MKNIVYIIIVTIFLYLIYLYSGGYNISATKPHFIFIESIIHEFKENSIRSNSKKIIVPKLDNQLDIIRGFKSYDDMCVICHSAPGKPPSIIQQGLYPKPPKLYRLESEWNEEQLFWIIKNGVKLTGMPAYGPTHKDEEIWEIVAFLKKLPELSANEYKLMKEKAIKIKDDHNHVHPDGKVHKH